MTRVGPRRNLEPNCFIVWDDADFLSNDFLESLFKNMNKIVVEEMSETGCHVLVGIFSNMRLRLSFSWKKENDTCVFESGYFSIMYNNIYCPERLAWRPGGWDYYETKWLLDDSATKRIWAIYKKYKQCLNI